jgi:hypothetical protein
MYTRGPWALTASNGLLGSRNITDIKSSHSDHFEGAERLQSLQR